jgi:hypothetical protein
MNSEKNKNYTRLSNGFHLCFDRLLSGSASATFISGIRMGSTIPRTEQLDHLPLPIGGLLID